MTTIEQYNLALFNDDKEVSYSGYHRVFASFVGSNIETIEFPRVEQDDPVFVTHIVFLDGEGKEAHRIPYRHSWANNDDIELYEILPTTGDCDIACLLRATDKP